MSQYLGRGTSDDFWIEFYDAEDSDHAEEQALNANPEWCAVVCVATCAPIVPEARTRFAVVTNAQNAKALWAYLPANYAITSGIQGAEPRYLISGKDVAGWTLDDYVIPRLASGLIWATEVTDNNDLIYDFLKEANS